MPDRYAVIGHPVAHSRSPEIHAAFARETGQDMAYERILAPLDGFVAAVEAFRKQGGRGANVTLPFKLEAAALAHALSERARAAGAVNTLTFDGDAIAGDNTDGAGLVRDIQVNLRRPLRGARILVLGAGGATRGALGALLAEAPAAIFIVNRTAAKAIALAEAFAAAGPVSAGDGGGRHDVVINATSAGLGGNAVALPEDAFAPGALAYDMAYGEAARGFLAAARAAGAATLADGLGMLVEQAAESFLTWRGVRPSTAPVLAALRASLPATT